MGFLVRAFAMLKGAYDWFSFGSDAVTALGLAKRVAAGAAIVGTAASIPPAVHYINTPRQAQIVEAQSAVAAPGLVSDVRVGPDKLYSRLYLRQPEHKAVLDSILAKCKDTNEIPPNQCDIAVAANRDVEASRREAARREAFRRAAAEQAGSDSRIKLPSEYQLVK